MASISSMVDQASNWIETVSAKIEQLMSKIRPKAKVIPPLLLLCEAASRPGLSAIAMYCEIVRRLPEFGIPTGVNPDGTPNKILGLIQCISNGVVDSLLNDARVDITLPVVTSTGAVQVGPSGTGTATVFTKGLDPVYGIVR